jgi:hypothetical protein
MKKSFVLYCDTYDTLQHLSDDQLGKLTRLIFEYQINGSTPEPSNPLFIAFGFIKSSLDRDCLKYEERAERARENGAKGGRPIKNLVGKTETQKTQRVILKPKKPDSVSVSVNDSVSVNENVNVNFKKWGAKELIESMKPFKDMFNREMLNAFYEYWSEPMPNGKIRLTAQTAWDTKRRLSTWNKRDASKQPQTAPTPTRASRGVKME